MVARKNLEKGIEKGKAQGIVEGVLESLRNLIKNSEMTTDEAMAAIGISENDKEMYSAKLSK